MKEDKDKQQPQTQSPANVNDKQDKDVVYTSAVYDVGEGNYTDDEGNDIVGSGLGIDE